MTEPLTFPAELGDPLTSPIAQVLAEAYEPWNLAAIGRAFRDNGIDLPRRVEAECAYVLHWLLKVALEHGPDWRERAQAQIDALKPAHEAALEERRAAREAGRRAFENRGVH